MQGWVSFHRKIEEWEWYDDANTFRLFFHLVLKANHKDNKWRGIDIKRGELVTSNEQLAKQLKLTVSKIRTSLVKLKSTGEITIKTTNKNTVVTVANYSLYQSAKEEIATKTTNKSQSNRNQIATNNNDNNENNDNNIYIQPLVKHWNSKDMLSNHKADSKGIIKSISENIVVELDYNQAIEGIDNYYKALVDSTFYYTHNFKLDKFITQSNGYKDWIKNGIRSNEFDEHLKKKTPVKQVNEKIHNFDERSNSVPTQDMLNMKRR